MSGQKRGTVGNGRHLSRRRFPEDGGALADTNAGRTPAPDEEALRRSAARIGWQVSAVSALLVVIGGAVILAFLFWQTTPAEANKAPQPGEIEVRLDPGELALAALLLAAGAVISAGLAARTIARRAVAPLDEAFRMQRRFVADVSHELRTPLAVIDARAQQLSALTPADDPRRPVLTELRDDVRIMSGVIGIMLDTAAGARPVAGTAALDEALPAVARDLAEIAGPRGIEIRATSEPVTVDVPAAVLRRCLVALVDNALDHSPPGTTVTLNGSRSGDRATVTVTDAGPGIRGIAPERVFDRFAQGDPPDAGLGAPRNSRGIGLALVRELCDAYGGAARVARTGPEGTAFELTLPAASPQAGVR